MNDMSFAMQQQQPDRMVQWCSPTIDSQHFSSTHPLTPPRQPQPARDQFSELSNTRTPSHVPFGESRLPQLPLNHLPLSQNYSSTPARYPTLFPPPTQQRHTFITTGLPSSFDNMHTRATPQGFPTQNQPLEYAAARRASHPVGSPAPGRPQQHHMHMHMRASMPDVPTQSEFAWDHRHHNPTEAGLRPFTAQHVPYSGASFNVFEQPYLPVNPAPTYVNAPPRAAAVNEKAVASTEFADRPVSNHSTEEIVVSSQKSADILQPPTTKALPARMPTTTNSSDKENSTPAEVSRKKSSSSSTSQASASAAGSMMAEGVKSRQRSQVMRFGQESVTHTLPPTASTAKTQKKSAPVQSASTAKTTGNNKLTPRAQLSQHPKAVESRIYRASKAEGWTPERTTAEIAAARAAGKLTKVSASEPKPARAKRAKKNQNAVAAAAAGEDFAEVAEGPAEQPSAPGATATRDGEAEQAVENVSTVRSKRAAEGDMAVRRLSKRLRGTPIPTTPFEQRSSSATIGHAAAAAPSEEDAGDEADATGDTITPVSRSTQLPPTDSGVGEDNNEESAGQTHPDVNMEEVDDSEHNAQAQAELPESNAIVTHSSSPTGGASSKRSLRRKSRNPELSLGQTSLDEDQLHFVRSLAKNGEDLDWTGIDDHHERGSIYRKVINLRTAAERRSRLGDGSPVPRAIKQKRSRATRSQAARNETPSSQPENDEPPPPQTENTEPPSSQPENHEPHSLQPENNELPQPDGTADAVGESNPAIVYQSRLEQSMDDINRYTQPGEDLDWTKDTDRKVRERKQAIINKRKGQDPNKAPPFRRKSAATVEKPAKASPIPCRTMSARSARHKDKRSYVDSVEPQEESEVDREEETPAPQTQELKTGKIEFTDGTFADVDFVDGLQLVLSKKAKAAGFPGKQAKRILDLLGVAEPPRTGEALWLVTAEQAAKWLAPNQYFDGPIVVHGQQTLPLQSIDDFLGEHFDDSVKVSIQDPSTNNNPHVRDVSMRHIKDRFSQPVTGNPWNLLELATHRDDGIRPLFLNTSECTLLTKVKLPESGDTASRKGFTDGWKEVEKWTLVAQAGALTEPHQDSHGYSTYITINQGVVGFGWLSKPTAEERAGWCKNHNSFLGGRWRYVILRPGMTVYFPAGTVHFVFRHPDAGNTLAFGGHVLRCSQIVRWIDVLLQETAIPNVTNEDLSLSAPGYLKVVEKFVKQALKTGQVEAWGGKESIELFLEKKKEFEQLQADIEKRKRGEEKKKRSGRLSTEWR